MSNHLNFDIPDTLPPLTLPPKVSPNPSGILADIYDGSFYFDQNPDVAFAVGPTGVFANANPVDHFLAFGYAENRASSPVMDEFFDASAYLAQNNDVDQAVQNGVFDSALHHFLEFGLREGRDPGVGFDSSAYLSRNPDVDDAVDNGLFASAFAHFVGFGVDEGRFPGSSGKDGEFVLGTQESDDLTGTPDDDTIVPMQGPDTVNATAGQDEIDLGNDAGWINPASQTPAPISDFEDTIVYDSQSQSPVTGDPSDVSGDGDTIENFNDNDKIDLSGLSLSNQSVDVESGLNFDSLLLGKLGFFEEFSLGGVVEHGVVVASDGNNGRVFVDADGDGDLTNSDMTIELAGQSDTSTFSSSDDFIFS